MRDKHKQDHKPARHGKTASWFDHLFDREDDSQPSERSPERND